MKSLFSAVAACRVAGPLEAASGECEAAFLFPPSFPGFAGHFPGKPVLPGIAQIMAVVHVCGLPAPAAMRSIKTCKFLRPVFPDERIDMTVSRSGTEDGGIKARAALRVGGELCASMTLFFHQGGSPC